VYTGLQPLTSHARSTVAMSGARRRCWVYRSSRKAELYLYLARKDGFEVVPDGLMKLMGRAELVMELDLHAQRKLARSEVGRVMADLDSRGFYLQMPPPRPGLARVRGSSGLRGKPEGDDP
jgi:uncharacterized protein YcgL (UPF0745 family)